ncbi:MAG TPA: NAD-dependent epimerase/dehydratase family protein [Candidatus Cloacimonadota bacterium]|nr:NAD-dependent epimerase/dehydratase family protein [Candidatus Cloacimonadota bacterium]
MTKLLITGITGFVGKATLRRILEVYPELEITALVRPNTAEQRYQEFVPRIEVFPLDLADTKGLQMFLGTREYDTILHIGAIRGGRKFAREDYYRSNVGSTEQFVEYCLKSQARLIFCSSVGVYGAIPGELPANLASSFNPDNYYHYTKIEAEKIINRAILRGLQAAVVRPSITYGKGDFGFPYQLIKMVHKHRFPLISKRIWIHLCHIEALVDAFMWMLAHDHRSGLTWNVADRDPVQLNALVDFISRQVHNKNYPRWLRVDPMFFRLGEKISRILKHELFISRFELISKSWFYDVQDYWTVMEAEGKSPHFTIPELRITINDYLGK